MKTLYFIDKDKVRHIVCSDVGNIGEAMQIVYDVLNVQAITFDYIRTIHHGKTITFDFGSHTEFFELV